MEIKVYHGYGHENDLIVFGHVLEASKSQQQTFTNSVLKNMVQLVKLFVVKPVGGIKVRLQWNNTLYETTTAKDGFFRFEWQSETSTPAGWHTVSVEATGTGNSLLATGEGKIFIPHIAQHVFISDIDDTILVSHSATVIKRLRVLLSKNPHTRKPFEDVVAHYNLLAKANRQDAVPNPFFYVSSSEWNLYDYLNEFFAFNGLPKGAFLLNAIKKLHELVKTGKTKHEGKFMRIARIIKTFPNQQFVLLGDNSQKDPSIYAAVTEGFPGNVYAVYIRNVHKEKVQETQEILAGMEQRGVKTCFYTGSPEAIEHSRMIGLI